MEANKIQVTSSEISNLWLTFVSNSMGICVLKYFSAKAEDSEAKTVIDSALSVAQKQCDKIRDIFHLENIPIPQGFTEEDVDVDAPRLFSDMYAIQYVKNMANVGMLTHSASLYISSRADIRDFFQACLASSSELDQKSTEALLSKGVYIRPPYIYPPNKTDFVMNQSFLTGWFGDRRAISGLEITNLFINILLNSLGKALIMGFSQVVKSKDVRKYFIRGKQLATKQMTVFSSVLMDEDINVPPSWDSHVTDATIAPFSEKLMLFHVNALISTAIAQYGVAISTSPRRDIAAHYSRLLPEILLYGEDGANLMIEHGWMEQPPQAVKREALIKQ